MGNRKGATEEEPRIEVRQMVSVSLSAEEVEDALRDRLEKVYVPTGAAPAAEGEVTIQFYTNNDGRLNSAVLSYNRAADK